MFLFVGLVAATAFAEQEPKPRGLTLADAITLALQHNPDLATARHRADATKAGIDQAAASIWPRLTAGAGYSASDNPVQAFMMDLNQRNLSFGPSVDFNDPPVTDNVNGHVIASYTIYQGGRDAAQRAAATYIAEAATHNIDAVHNELIYEVTRSWYMVHKARAFLQAATQSVASMEANLQIARDRLDAGQVLKTDVLDAEVRLAAAREAVVTTRNAVALTESIFRNVIGMDQSAAVTVAEAEDNPLQTTDYRPQTTDHGPQAEEAEEAVVAELPDVSNRPELAAAAKAVAAAEKQVRAARAGHYPRVNAFARYDLNSGNARDYADSWLAGVSVEVDLFDGFLTRGQVTEAQARLAEAREQMRKLELGLQLEARQAALNVGEARARLATTVRAVDQAAESLQITKDRYASGMALLTQVLDAETALTAARQRHAAAETDLQIAQAALAKATGTGMDRMTTRRTQK